MTKIQRRRKQISIGGGGPTPTNFKYQLLRMMYHIHAYIGLYRKVVFEPPLVLIGGGQAYCSLSGRGKDWKLCVFYYRS